MDNTQDKNIWDNKNRYLAFVTAGSTINLPKCYTSIEFQYLSSQYNKDKDYLISYILFKNFNSMNFYKQKQDYDNLNTLLYGRIKVVNSTVSYNSSNNSMTPVPTGEYLFTGKNCYYYKDKTPAYILADTMLQFKNYINWYIDNFT
jgi:hypothetical protein